VPTRALKSRRRSIADDDGPPAIILYILRGDTREIAAREGIDPDLPPTEIIDRAVAAGNAKAILISRQFAQDLVALAAEGDGACMP
jgi:hypothetical protein